MVIRKSLPNIKEINDFLPRRFDVVLEKMRRNSRNRLKALKAFYDNSGCGKSRGYSYRVKK